MDRAVAICFVGSAVDQAGNNFLVTVGNTGWPDYRFRVTQMSLTESGSYFLGVANAISPPCSCSVPARGGKEWEIHPLPIATAHATVYGRNATPNGSRHTRGNVPGMIFPFSVSMRE